MSGVDLAQAAGVGSVIKIETREGHVVAATVDRIDQLARTGTRSTRRKNWSRWAGTIEDLIDVIREISDEVEARSGQPPLTHVLILWKSQDAEEFDDLESFESQLKVPADKRPDLDLRKLAELTVNVVSTSSTQLAATITFASVSPAVRLDLVAGDKTVAAGLRADIGTLLARGRGKVPSPNQLVMMILGALAGFAYYQLIDSVDFNFLPPGGVGTALFLVMYLTGYFALLYGVLYGVRLVLPPLRLASATADLSRVRSWLPRAAGALGTAALGALLPLILKGIFGDS